MQNIILLHGALGCASDLRHLAARFESKGFNPHLFSFSGHGKVPFNAEFSIAQFAQELKDYISSKNLDNPHVFGYSMGGFVALYLSSKGEVPIKTVITLGTKFNWNRQSVEKETAQLNADVILQKVPAFAKTLEEKHGENWKSLLSRTAGLMWDIHEKNYLSKNALSGIGSKALVGLADRDQMVSLDETRDVFQTIPGAAMFMLPGAKHQIESIHPNLLVDLVCPLLT